MDARQFLGSKFLAKEDLDRFGGELTVTIRVVGTTDFDGAEMKLTVGVEELRKPIVLNKTNVRRLGDIFGSYDTQEWIGRRFNLYVDPNVTFGDRVVGGLRVRAENYNTATSAPPRAEAQDLSLPKRGPSRGQAAPPSLDAS